MRRALEALEQIPGGLVYAEDMLSDWAEEAKRADRTYKREHWGDEATKLSPGEIARVRPGDVLVELGELAEIAYDTTKQGEAAIFVHKFLRTRPRLAHTQDGRLVIVGGSYRVTEAGIVG